ncbi:hypothetical protein C3E94_26535, partial [Klebsiella pneumoniae]
LRTLGIGLAPVVLAHQSRVALGDDIGETLKARVVAILIGERPGLSSPDSLGVYLTWQPLDPRPAALSADAGYRPGAGGAGASVAGGAGR